MTPKAKGTRSSAVRPPRPELAPRKSTSRPAAKRSIDATSAGRVAALERAEQWRRDHEFARRAADHFPQAGAEITGLWLRLGRILERGYAAETMGQLSAPPAVGAMAFAAALRTFLREVQVELSAGELERAFVLLARMLCDLVGPSPTSRSALEDFWRGQIAAEARKRGGKAPKPRPSKLAPEELRELRGKAKAMKRTNPRMGREKIAARLALDSGRTVPVSHRRLVDLLWPPPSRER